MRELLFEKPTSVFSIVPSGRNYGKSTFSREKVLAVRTPYPILHPQPPSNP